MFHKQRFLYNGKVHLVEFIYENECSGDAEVTVYVYATIFTVDCVMVSVDVLPKIWPANMEEKNGKICTGHTAAIGMNIKYLPMVHQI